LPQHIDPTWKGVKAQPAGNPAHSSQPYKLPSGV
jgi:hypothetical protein